MFLQRAVAALTLGPLALWLVWLGGAYYAVPVVLVFLVATIEYRSLISRVGWHLPRELLLGINLLLLIAAQWLPEWLPLLLYVGFVASALYALARYEQGAGIEALHVWFALTVGMVLFGWLGGYFLRLRTLAPDGLNWTLFALLATWSFETGAYLTGRFLAGRVLGRHHPTPRLSPKKTTEGYVGGLLLSLALGVTVGAVILQLPLAALIVVVFFTALIASSGDLAMSMLKRLAQAKDSGVLFPGHGGAIDRVDTLLWSMAFTYFVAAGVGG